MELGQGYLIGVSQQETITRHYNHYKRGSRLTLGGKIHKYLVLVVSRQVG